MDKEEFKIADLALMTQLSQRTIRNYIKDGRLHGKKVQGTWIFTKEDIMSFFHDPYVKEGLLIKNQTLIDDFVRDRKKKRSSLCTIYDYPVSNSQEAKEISEIITKQISLECQKEIKMSYYFDEASNQVRIILIGEKEEVIRLLQFLD